MSEITFYQHRNYSYEKLKSLIENTSKNDLNKALSCKCTVLSFAIRERFSLKLIEKLLIQGSDPNIKIGFFSEYPLSLACEMIRQNGDYGTNLYELLLHYGADVNIMGYNHFFEYLLLIVKNNIELRLIPIIYQKANHVMISYTLKKLMVQILGCNESELKNYIKVTEIIFMLRDQLIKYDLYSLINLITLKFKISFYYRLRKLFEIIISNMFRNSFENDSTFMSFIKDFCENLFCRRDSWYSLKILIVEDLKNIWFKCFEQCEKMKKDILSNGCTVLKVMQTPNVADAYCMYKLLLRLNEYSYFKSILSYRVKEYNHIIKLYDVINYYHPSILSVDVFAHLSKYISKDDIFNILLASIPKC